MSSQYLWLEMQQQYTWKKPENPLNSPKKDIAAVQLLYNLGEHNGGRVLNFLENQ